MPRFVLDKSVVLNSLDELLSGKNSVLWVRTHLREWTVWQFPGHVPRFVFDKSIAARETMVGSPISASDGARTRCQFAESVLGLVRDILTSRGVLVGGQITSSGGRAKGAERERAIRIMTQETLGHTYYSPRYFEGVQELAIEPFTAFLWIVLAIARVIPIETDFTILFPGSRSFLRWRSFGG